MISQLFLTRKGWLSCYPDIEDALQTIGREILGYDQPKILFWWYSHIATKKQISSKHQPQRVGTSNKKEDQQWWWTNSARTSLDTSGLCTPLEDPTYLWRSNRESITIKGTQYPNNMRDINNFTNRNIIALAQPIQPTVGPTMNKIRRIWTSRGHWRQGQNYEQPAIVVATSSKGHWREHSLPSPAVVNLWL